MSKLTKGTLSKSGLSMGSIEKTAMPQLKEEVTIAEQRTTIMIPVDVYKAAKKYALLNDIKLKCTQKQIIWCTDSDTKDE